MDSQTQPQGQNFASVATIRAAILDAIDRAGKPWHFDPFDESDDQSEHRGRFVDAVIDLVGDLQSPPFNQTKLENLCPRHRREALPAPTANVCVMCESERKVVNRG